MEIEETISSLDNITAAIDMCDYVKANCDYESVKLLYC